MLFWLSVPFRDWARLHTVTYGWGGKGILTLHPQLPTHCWINAEWKSFIPVEAERQTVTH